MAAEIAKLGHTALVTPNMEKSLWFFSRCDWFGRG